jgi:hypothetical protein
MASDGLYHTIRNAEGSWQPTFGLVEDQVTGGPAGFAAVGCAGVGEVMHLVGVGTDAQLYHTFRDATGGWQNDFGPVRDQVTGGPAEFHQVSCAGTGAALQVVGLGADEQLYHTIRNADGGWQNYFGPVKDQVTGGPAGFRQLSCGGTGDALQVVGGTWQGGWL